MDQLKSRGIITVIVEYDLLTRMSSSVCAGTRAHVYSLLWSGISSRKSAKQADNPTLESIEHVGKKIVFPHPLASLQPSEVSQKMHTFFAAVSVAATHSISS